jgi:hypothetical protein
MSKTAATTRIFIASSTPNKPVARAFADCLENRGFQATIWDEWVFEQNESTFDGLLRVSREYHYAAVIWGPSDLTTTNGEPISSPRDNVIFEAGLFLGALGRHRVFIAEDRTASIKIPSDYNGITCVTYDGSRIERDPQSAVRSACNEITNRINNPTIASNLRVLAGDWKSLYAAGPDEEHREVMDDVVITAEPEGISFTSGSFHGLVPYSGRGKVYYKNQIMGQWNHPTDRSMAEGLFMLMVNPTADVMYGYSTSQDAHGATIYGTWVFAKTGERTDEDIKDKLFRGQITLRQRTISPPPRQGMSM